MSVSILLISIIVNSYDPVYCIIDGITVLEIMKVFNSVVINYHNNQQHAD